MYKYNQPIDTPTGSSTSVLQDLEQFWICTLHTMNPYGLNSKWFFRKTKLHSCLTRDCQSISGGGGANPQRWGPCSPTTVGFLFHTHTHTQFYISRGWSHNSMDTLPSPPPPPLSLSRFTRHHLGLPWTVDPVDLVDWAHIPYL